MSWIRPLKYIRPQVELSSPECISLLFFHITNEWMNDRENKENFYHAACLVNVRKFTQSEWRKKVKIKQKIHKKGFTIVYFCIHFCGDWGFIFLFSRIALPFCGRKLKSQFISWICWRLEQCHKGWGIPPYSLFTIPTIIVNKKKSHPQITESSKMSVYSSNGVS